MKNYVKFIDDLPYVLKVILAFPGIDGIVYGLYRIGKGQLIAGLIWIIVGTVLTWILDLYSLYKFKKITFFV